ncbi:putative ribonuclease H-like domain-containing protein [Tanacetum coccineum]
MEPMRNGFKKREDRSDMCNQECKKKKLLDWSMYDDIIFGITNKDLSTAFEKLMKDKFQMSSLGELTFFLGLLVTQKEDRIFISQDKYVAEILKKFNYTYVKSAYTLVVLEKANSSKMVMRCMGYCVVEKQSLKLSIN